MNKKITNKEDRAFVITINIMLFIALIIVLYPLYFVLIASISDPVNVTLGQVTLFPKGISFDGYIRILEKSDLWVGYRNTIMYTVVGTIINLTITLTGAYAMSRKDLAGRNIFMGYMAFTMFFSGGLIPYYFLIKSLGLLNSFWVMIIPGAVSVFNLIIARTFFQSNIPDELHEAAKLDGCSDARFFISIVLPLSKAIIAVLTLYCAVGHWNSFFNALIFIRDKNLFPLQLILREILIGSQLSEDMLNAMGDGESAQKAAMIAESMKYGVIIVSSLPVLILYPFLQKYFMKGVMIGAIKG